jgi:isopentenyl-diphosphate delta-isomerase
MPELLEILDDQGRKTNSFKDRVKVHIDGNWHASAHLWCIDRENNILLQQRSLQKTFYPGQWCAPVSGHIPAKSDAVTTVIKEAREELNLPLKPEQFFLQAVIRGSFDEPALGLKEREFIYMFVLKKVPDMDTNFSNDEVAGFKWFSKSHFRKMVESRDPSLVPAFPEYEIILSYIKNLKK